MLLKMFLISPPMIRSSGRSWSPARITENAGTFSLVEISADGLAQAHDV